MAGINMPKSTKKKSEFKYQANPDQPAWLAGIISGKAKV